YSSERTECRDDEEFVTCGSACADTCYNYKNELRMCTLQCVVGCACKNGLVRHSNGSCVHAIEC
ncbi:zonadhesin-like protein, partial [Leptotrombidium deliense]